MDEIRFAKRGPGHVTNVYKAISGYVFGEANIMI